MDDDMLYDEIDGLEEMLLEVNVRDFPHYFAVALMAETKKFALLHTSVLVCSGAV